MKIFNIIIYFCTSFLISIIIYILIKMILILNKFLIYSINLYMQIWLKVFMIIINYLFYIIEIYIFNKEYINNIFSKKYYFFVCILRIIILLFISWINIRYIFVWLLYNYLYISILLSILFMISLEKEKALILFKNSFVLNLILYYIGWYCFFLFINWNLLFSIKEFYHLRLNEEKEKPKSFLYKVEFICECIFFFSVIKLLKPFYKKCVALEAFHHKSIWEYSISKINIFFSILIFFIFLLFYLLNKNNIENILNIDIITYIISYFDIINISDSNYYSSHRYILWFYIKSKLSSWFTFLWNHYHDRVIQIIIWITLVIFFKIFI